MEAELARGHYPLLLTPLNTAGEKPYEEVLSKGEQSREIDMANLLAVPYRAAPHGAVLAIGVERPRTGPARPPNSAEESLLTKTAIKTNDAPLWHPDSRAGIRHGGRR